MILLYHNDFDGIASAAILRRQLVRWHIPVSRCVPVDYGTPWLSWPHEAANEPFAVVDFQYHPYAIAWVDHHATTFSSPGFRAHFDVRQQDGDTVMWDAAAPSCAQLLETWLGSTEHPTVVAAANKIDQAQFSSPDEYLTKRTPEIDLMHTNRYMTPKQRETILDALEADDMDGAAWVMRREAATACQQRYESLEVSRESCWLRGNVVMCNAVGYPHLRFSPFKFHPTAQFACVVASRRDRGYLINVYKNPWQESHPAHVGQMLQRHGGGGHAGAGVVQFPDGELQTVWALARELAQAVQVS